MGTKSNSLRQPPYLKKGDKIGVLSTARKMTLDEIQFAIDTILDWGLNPVLGKNIFASENQFAGSDQKRIDDFQQMINDSEIKAIICARGGYGTVRIIDKLNFESFKKNPKWIAGFSDITVLHSHIHNLQVCSLHSSMPITFAQNTLEALNSLKKTLFGENIAVITERHPLNIEGCCKGQIVGGNLSVLHSLIGSPTDIDTRDKILLLEDIDEYLYHIDRMMINFKRSERLSGLSGLIVGGMTQMNDNTIAFGKTAEKIIYDCVSDYAFPVCFNFPVGHIKNNLTLQLGRMSYLSVANNVHLSYE